MQSAEFDSGSLRQLVLSHIKPIKQFIKRVQNVTKSSVRSIIFKKLGFVLFNKDSAE